MVKTKTTTEYREGTLGWWLMEAGWTPIEQVNCDRGGKHSKDQFSRCSKCGQLVYPLWRFGDFDKLVTGSHARQLELQRIDYEFQERETD